MVHLIFWEPPGETRPDPARAWQVRDTLGALAERFATLRIDGGVLHASRLARPHARGLALKRVVMYSPNWVRSQNRMSSTSNQARRRPPSHSPPDVSTLQTAMLQLAHGARVGARTRLQPTPSLGKEYAEVSRHACMLI